MSSDADVAIQQWNDPHRLPPELRPLWITTMRFAAHAIYVLAKLSVADALVEGPRRVDELAAGAEVDAGALYRVLRCAASVGVFTEEEDGSFALTPAAEPLRSEGPTSMRDLIVLYGEDISWKQYGEILHAVRTGEPVFERTFGAPFFDYLEAHPDEDQLFQVAGAQVAGPVTDGYLRTYDFGRFARIADIGGGSGQFLARVLQTCRDSRGIVVDRPVPVRFADEVFRKHGVADRASAVVGNFFTEVPSGHDAYVLKSILHDWPDDRAEVILRRVRDAVGGTDARLLVLDGVLRDRNEPDHGKLLDVHMLVTFGGRERTLTEWTSLLGRAGFALEGEPVLGPWPVLTCRPVAVP